jgi:acyl carrier protein
MIEKLRALLSEALAATSEAPLESHDLNGDLLTRLDSLVLVAFIALIERELGVTIDDSDITPEAFESLSAVATLLEAKAAD